MGFRPLPIGVDDFKTLISKGYTCVYHYGIAFYKKQCRIKGRFIEFN